jgi:predicted nucleic-acid-binding protein
MIGLDTNVILRALTGDDPIRSSVAARILTDLSPERPGYVNLVVLAELVWTLGRKHKADREAVFEAVESLLESRSIVVAEREVVVATLEHARTERLDFADALIGSLNRHAGCRTTLTFDVQAGKAGSFAPAL